MGATRIKRDRLLIGDLVLDPGKRQISRRGRAVKMPKLSYRLFAALAEAAPDLVTHDQLVQQVWRGSVVSPETITQRVKLVREALGDAAAAPRYIALVRGEGYRLIPDVVILPEDAENLTRGLVAELGRRRVLQVALVYAAVAWSITEVVSFLIEALPVFPAWSKALVAILFVVGFPVAMFLAWRFDIGPRGIKRTQAATTEGRVTIVAAVALMLGATAGLFYLIYPRVVEQALEVSPSALEPLGNTIAVLPFQNASKDPDDLYISEGLGDDLRILLGQVQGLRVAARSSSVIFRDAGIDATGISDQLGVARLVEGTMRRDGDKLKIVVQIIDGQSGFELWTDVYERSVGELQAVQQEIARRIIGQVLPDQAAAFADAQPPILNASAHDLMLIARHYYQQVQDDPVVDLETLSRTIDLYRQATIADPESALAHSRLAASLLILGDVEQAKGPIFQALAIDSDLTEVQYTLGLYYLRRFQPGAGQAFERAIKLNPSNVDALSAYAKWTWAQGDTNSAEPFFRRAMELDPMSISRYADIGNFYGIAGYAGKALDISARLEERFRSPRAYLEIARIRETVGDLDVAIAWALRARNMAPDYTDATWMLAELYSRIHDFEAARFFEPEPAIGPLFYARRYDELIELSEELVLEYPNQVDVWFVLGRSYLATGRYDQAIHVLKNTGIPDNVYVDSRRTTAVEALVDLADAYKQTGELTVAREFGEWLVDFFGTTANLGTGNSWWVNLYLVCSLSIIDEHEAALERMQYIINSSGMAWYPVVKDQPCFTRYAGTPQYEALLGHLEKQKADLRTRLPDTLARMQTER